MTTATDIKNIYKKRKIDAHKGTAGHVLIIGGSYGKIGSIVLASKAAMRAGSGLVTAYIPHCGYNIIQTAVAEVMVLTDKNANRISEIKYDIEPQAIGIGPGMGTDFETKSAFKLFLDNVSVPLIIDADALNILSVERDYLDRLKEDSILTPHPKELERLIGKFANHQEMVDKTQVFCQKYKVIVVAKGAPTFLITSNEVFENSTGNSALATAGSGDVLTGIITSLRGQGYSAINAAKLGVYLHGLAADIGAPKIGVESFMASDIISNLGSAFLSLS